ncbi:hypothetical protein [Amycolatopsis sp. NPDC051071]|uniref:hypothetical protein n=1 Tax=Amycolatopsis sp. NPDC051071 TaxID=3154637 RepID=UPI00341757E8
MNGLRIDLGGKHVDMWRPVKEHAGLSERQRRSRRWIAGHPGVMTVVPAVIFGALGWSFGSNDDEVSWLNPAVAGVLGVVFGVLFGYGLSMECREQKPKGARRVLVIVGLVFCAAVGLGMRYLRYRT